MARTISLMVVLLLAAGAAAYYFLAQRNVTLEFTEEDLRTHLEDQLPFSQDYLFIFTVTLDNPRIDLVEGSDRVTGGMDAVLNARIGGREEPLGGGIDISGGLRYQPETGEFYLNDPVVEKVRIQGLSETLSNRANRALSLALAEFYQERPIYSLSNLDVKHATARLFLRNVSVRDETLFVTLGLNKNGEKLNQPAHTLSNKATQ